MATNVGYTHTHNFQGNVWKAEEMSSNQRLTVTPATMTPITAKLIIFTLFMALGRLVLLFDASGPFFLACKQDIQWTLAPYRNLR